MNLHHSENLKFHIGLDVNSVQTPIEDMGVVYFKLLSHICLDVVRKRKNRQNHSKKCPQSESIKILTFCALRPVVLFLKG
jgi:hypothetical protein